MPSNPLSHIEGHANINIQLDDNGEVASDNTNSNSIIQLQQSRVEPTSYGKFPYAKSWGQGFSEDIDNPKGIYRSNYLVRLNAWDYIPPPLPRLNWKRSGNNSDVLPSILCFIIGPDLSSWLMPVKSPLNL